MIQRKYEDYAERLYEEFPNVDKKSIDSIVIHGLKRIAYFIKLKQDIMLETNNKINSFYLYIGKVDTKIQQIPQYIRSKYAEHTKLRRLEKEKKIKHDGTYYFGLTEEENSLEILPSVNLYKIEKECTIRNNVKYIYKTKFDDNKWCVKQNNFDKNKAELISTRNIKQYEKDSTE